MSNKRLNNNIVLYNKIVRVYLLRNVSEKKKISQFTG